MFRKDFLPCPDPFWSFASVSARPFWCTLHPHAMFARTFLSAPVTSPSCTFQALRLIFSLCFGESLFSSGLFCSSPLPSQTQDPFLWVHSSWRRGVRGVKGAGDQGPGFPPTSRGRGYGNYCACLCFWWGFLPASSFQLFSNLTSSG